MKKKSTDYERIIFSYIFDWIISRIYKELQKRVKETNDPIKKID